MNPIYIIETQMDKVQLGIYNNLYFTSRPHALSYLRMQLGTHNLCTYNRIGLQHKKTKAVFYINPLKIYQ